MEVNSYQTEYDQEYIDSLPEEVQEQYYDFTTNVPYIRSLIAKDRPYAKDLPRDNEGKIIIDITKPHILEDMDYFRPSAIHYKKYGCYSKLRPNFNPNSEYGKWIREEIRRCWNGYVRPSDGEWITGDMYFFLNYCPIQLIKKDDTGKNIRTVDFPSVWDGHYYRFHYLNQCRNEGKHAIELAKRGAGKAHPYDEIAYTTSGLKYWKDVHIGDYLYGDDGNITKVIDIPFDGIASIYELELANGNIVRGSEEHLWKVISHVKGTVVVSTKELLSMYKRPRKTGPHNHNGYELDCSIPVSKGVEFNYKKTKVDPYTFGLLLGNDCSRINRCKSKTYFTSRDKDFEVPKNYIPYNWIKYNTKFGYNISIPDLGDIWEEYDLYFKKSEDKFIPKEYMYNSREVRINLLKGILDVRGTVDKKGRIEIVLTSKTLIRDIKWLCSSLGINYTKERIKRCRHYNDNRDRASCLDSYKLSIYSNIPLFNSSKKLELWLNRPNTEYAKSKYKGSKIVNIRYIGDYPAKCVTVDNKSHCYLINNFVVTHNSFSAAAMLAKRFILGESEQVKKKVQCVATASERKYIQGANQLLDMFQYYIDFCANNTEFPRQRLTSSIQGLSWTMGYIDSETMTRKGSENSVVGITSKDDESKLRGSRGVLYLLEEGGCHLKGTECYKADKTIEKVENIKVGDFLLGPDMKPRKVLKTFTGIRPMYKITLANGDTQVVTDNHPVYVKVLNNTEDEFTTFTCEELLSSDYKNNYRIVKQTTICDAEELSPNNRIDLLEYSFTIEPYGDGKYYGFLIDGDHLFLLSDRTIVHNTFPRLLNLYQVLRPSVEDGNDVFGLIYCYGTSADNDSDFSSMQELMYNPKGYNIKAIDNIYDKEGQGRVNFTYFFPGYLNRSGCYDEDGNSDVTKALLEILLDRYKVKYNSSDINAITKRIAEIPVTPQEAILKTRGNIFPITEITQKLNEIDNNPTFYDDTYVGTLVMNSSGEVNFNPVTEDKPIREFPLKDNKATGAIEIYEMPQQVNGKVPFSRYIASIDNYENDRANTMSLGSIFVLDLWTDRIVAEYTGRPAFADDLNEICRKMCIFYNARVMAENNKKNTFTYFSRMNSLHLMADTPEYLKNRQLIKTPGFGNSSKGITATTPIINFAMGLIRDWLLKPVNIVEEKDGETITTIVHNLHFIKNRALLKELMLYNPAVNCDRVMSLCQLMLYREEKMILYQGDLKRGAGKPQASYLGNDEFFSKNYNEHYTNK